MNARFWVLALAGAILVTSAGCGSCRWRERHGRYPYACVNPRCSDPTCAVCSPLPPLYDGWMCSSPCGGCSCGCGGMPCGGVVMDGCGAMCGPEMSCGSCSSCGGMNDCGSCGGCSGGMMMNQSCAGGSCGMPSCSAPQVCPQCHQPAPSCMAPQTYDTGMNPNAAIFSLPPNEPQPTMQSVPMSPPSQPADQLAPEPPPTASAASVIRPSEYYAPNKPLLDVPAPRPITAPLQLSSPPQWETSLEVKPVEPTSLRAPQFR